jgi:hypothetical protein
MLPTSQLKCPVLGLLALLALAAPTACTKTQHGRADQAGGRPGDGAPGAPGNQAPAGDAKSGSGGVWSGGGGGEVISDTLNPWFVQNTTDVTVCAVVDPDAFHVRGDDLSGIAGAVATAFDYWKTELAKAFVVAKAVRVATQTFHVAPLITARGGAMDKPCPDDTRITVQLGYATDEQLAWLQAHAHEHAGAGRDGLPRLIGMAVRTAYDPIALAGEGFVFVAGDKGPTAVTDASLIPSPWAHGTTRLIEVLKHELGHVFGVPHRGFSGSSVMAPDYPETLLSAANGAWDSDGAIDSPFFGIEAPWTFREMCGGIRYGWAQFLGTTDADKCTKFVYDGDRIDMLAGPSSDALTRRGTLTLDPQDTFQWEDAIRLFVTAKQTAIALPDPNAGAGRAPLLAGPMIKINERQGVFKSEDGKLERRVELTLNPMGLGFSQSVFRVEMDGKTYRNLDFVYGPDQTSP